MAAIASIAGACSSALEPGAPSESQTRDERLGTIGLSLQPVMGITVSSVHFVVTAGDPSGVPAPAVASEGNLPTPGTGSTLSFGVPLPAGTGYYLSLSAESAETGDDVTCTAAFGPFAVAPNTSTQFNMVLTCVDNTNGQILSTVDVQTDACPRLIVDYAVAEPATGMIGGEPINLYSAAHDLDNPADVISFLWTIAQPPAASLGTFTPANARDTTFTCQNLGDSIEIIVTATNHECSKSLATVVSCTDGGTCGNGVVEPLVGETCDTFLDPTCPADCTQVCGDGIVEGDEQCDLFPPNIAQCLLPGDPNECQRRDPVCGDGFVTQPFEVCDTLGNVGPSGVPLPPGAFCPVNCTSIQPVHCGNGALEPGEECEVEPTGPGGRPIQPTRTCTQHCEQIATQECVDCEQAGDCFASSDNCLGPSFTPFTLDQSITCFDVMQCMQDSNCLDGAGSLAKCYCGTLGTAQCGAAPFDLSQPGAPNGPCAAIMQWGNPSATSNTQILGGLTGKAHPMGAAGQRLNCQKNDPVCAPLCGVE